MVRASRSSFFSVAGGVSSSEKGGVRKSPSALMKAKVSCTAAVFMASFFFSFSFLKAFRIGGGGAAGLMTGPEDGAATGMPSCLAFSRRSSWRLSVRRSCQAAHLFLKFSSHQPAKRTKENLDRIMIEAARSGSSRSMAPVEPTVAFSRLLVSFPTTPPVATCCPKRMVVSRKKANSVEREKIKPQEASSL